MNILFTCGCFDIIHIGHLKLLNYCNKYAKENNMKFILGLNSDSSIKNIKGFKRPINNQDYRLLFIKELNLDKLDQIIVFNEDTPIEIIRQLKLNNSSNVSNESNEITFIKGGDYNKESLSEFDKEGLINNILIYDFHQGNSTTNIISKIKSTFYLIDLDGTLIDTEPIHYKCYIDTFEYFNIDIKITYDEYINIINTIGMDKLIKNYSNSNSNLNFNEIKNYKKTLMKTYKNINFIDDKKEFLIDLLNNNINFCIVTNSNKETIEHYKTLDSLKLLNNIKNWITREDYTNPKPNNECYKLAIDKYYKGEQTIIGLENTKLGYNALEPFCDKIILI
jgi:rfaE bifunctional protein nucleotidyltransferase chain/domain